MRHSSNLFTFGRCPTRHHMIKIATYENFEMHLPGWSLPKQLQNKVNNKAFFFFKKKKKILKSTLMRFMMLDLSRWNMRRDARFGTICTTSKTWKTPLEEWFFGKVAGFSHICWTLTTKTHLNDVTTYFNPLIQNVQKWPDTLSISCSISWKIFKVCLTIFGYYALTLTSLGF